jgi:peptide/nickel transport system permease protein
LRTVYITRRLLGVIPTAIGITLVTFLLLHLIPGNPAVTLLGLRATPHNVAILQHQLGLDKPLYEQYWLFLSRIVRGNFGNSLYYNSSATGIILGDSAVTIMLVLYAAVLAVIIAIPLAVLAATHKDGLTDQAVRAVPLVGLGMPSAWLAIMLILLLGLKAHAFPVGGYGSGPVGHLYSLFLPALCLALGIAPVLVRSLRSSLIDALEADYVTTARSKGIPERRVLARHAVRNAVISSVSILGLQIAWLISGTVVIETVFGLPGIGALMVNSIYRRDFPVVQGITFILAISVIVINLATDIFRSLLDPRVSFD